MVSMVSPRHADVSDDLLIVDSPSLRERSSESFSDRPLLSDRPSFGRRFSRALVRFLVPCCIGVAATLAWQSYGDAARQTAATLAAQHGWSISWLDSPPRPATAQSAPAAQTPSDLAPNASVASSADLQQVKTMTLGLAATLTTMRDRIEQLAASQKDTANDIAKLQAVEQEIQHKMSTLTPRPAAAAASKPTPAAPPRALTPPPPPR
jgi:hypothetical protein